MGLDLTRSPYSFPSNQMRKVSSRNFAVGVCRAVSSWGRLRSRRECSPRLSILLLLLKTLWRTGLIISRLLDWHLQRVSYVLWPLCTTWFFIVLLKYINDHLYPYPSLLMWKCRTTRGKLAFIRFNPCVCISLQMALPTGRLWPSVGTVLTRLVGVSPPVLLGSVFAAAAPLLLHNSSAPPVRSYGLMVRASARPSLRDFQVSLPLDHTALLLANISARLLQAH